MSHLAVTRFNWQFNSINNLIYSKNSKNYSKKFDVVGGLIFGGAYIRRGICAEGNLRFKSIGLACSGKEIYHFCFVLLCMRGQIRRGDLSEGFLRYDFGGLIHGGAYFRNFTVFPCRS